MRGAKEGLGSIMAGRPHSVRGPSPVDDKGGAGHEARLIRSQKQRSGDHVLDPAKPVKRKRCGPTLFVRA